MTQCLAKQQHSLDLYFETINRNSDVLFWLTWLCARREGGVVDAGWGVYCADDFSPVQTSSSAALHSQQYTLSYCSQCDDLRIKTTTKNPLEVWAVCAASSLFSMVSMLGALSDIKFLFTQKQYVNMTALNVYFSQVITCSYIIISISLWIQITFVCVPCKIPVEFPHYTVTTARRFSLFINSSFIF